MNATGETLGRWVGRQEVADDVITPVPAAALAATLDFAPESSGQALLPLRHWLYFLPRHRRSELGPDGHARRGGFLPPVPLPRRMWAGGQLEFRRPLAIGDAVTRVSTIDSIEEKAGRSGPLVFVRVRHEIRRGDEADAALVELQDLVYRDAGTAGEAPTAGRRAPERSAWQQAFVPDDVVLFRYSALTFNGHRIHYDRRYATTVEGYPGLVVHGPLIATLLVELVRRERPAARIAAFAFRAVRPLFDTHAFVLCGVPDAEGGRIRLWAQDHEGWLAMEATATIA